MKKILYYVLLMTITVVLIPLIIVRGCSTVITDIVPPVPEEKKESARIIRVYVNSENAVREMPFEEYLKGVVAAEMPAEYEMEALKAQAVAARTYAYGRMKKIYTPKEDTHKGADICTDFAHCQAWIDKEHALSKWNSLKKGEYWDKIEKAVKETEDIVIIYENKVVNPVFHANSGGRTENSEDVWDGVVVPYLKSVKSEGEEESSGYKVETIFKEKDFIDKLKKSYPEIQVDEKKLIEEIKILDRTEGGGVKTLIVGNITLSGTDARSLLGLRSTNFKIEKGNEGELKITTLGYGHGVGMSQTGANYLARNGGTYEDIIKYYYQGVSIDTIDDVEMLFDDQS